MSYAKALQPLDLFFSPNINVEKSEHGKILENVSTWFLLWVEVGAGSLWKKNAGATTWFLGRFQENGLHSMSAGDPIPDTFRSTYILRRKR